MMTAIELVAGGFCLGAGTALLLLLLGRLKRRARRWTRVTVTVSERRGRYDYA